MGKFQFGTKVRFGITVVAFGTGICWTGQSEAAQIYIGLGDSITFGETDLNYVQSYGDRGYVADFANALATQSGGVAPTVVNLAIDGETASSFFTNAGRTPPVIGRGDAALQLENLNYQNSTALSQSQVFANTVATEIAMGNTISTISLTLGFNEIAALAPAANTPAAEALAIAQIAPTLMAFQANEQAVLNQIHSLAPSAALYLEGYYNPFPADPTSPAAPVFAVAGPELNSTIQSLAAEYNATYVNNATPFVGNEAAYTYLAAQPAGSSVAGQFGGTLPIGNVHPNALGYQVIANDTVAVAVPEPATWTMLVVGLGLAMVVTRGQRRRGDTFNL